MPREIWTLHKRHEVADAIRAVHLDQFFKLPPWGTNYMRAHELMSSIQYDGKAMLTDSDGSKVEVLITKDIVNKALHFQPGTYDLIPKTKAIDNEKAFLKVKGNKFKYSDLIYSELELSLRLISQHFRVQKPPSSKGAEALGPSEHEQSDEGDTSTPLDKNSRSQDQDQILMDEAMARVEARRKKLDETRAAKAAKTTKPTIMEEAKKLRIEKAKALQEKRKRLEAEQKAQEEAAAAQAAQRAAQLAREKIKEALSRKAEGPILEPSQGSPKRPRLEDEEEMEHIQADPPRSSPMSIPPAPPSSPITPFPPPSSLRTPPSPTTLDPQRSPPAPTSPQQQQQSAKPTEVPPSTLEEDKTSDQAREKTKEKDKQADPTKPKPAGIEFQVPLMQLEEPTQEEAYKEEGKLIFKTRATSNISFEDSVNQKLNTPLKTIVEDSFSDSSLEQSYFEIKSSSTKINFDLGPGHEGQSSDRASNHKLLFLKFQFVNKLGAKFYKDEMERYCAKVEDRWDDMRDMVPVIYSGDRYFDGQGFMYIVVLIPSIVNKWGITGTKEKVDVEPEETPLALNKPNLKLQKVNDMTRVNTDNIFLGLYKYDEG
ncbi:hypothetical protein L7F22_068588 [Adiantum nelumboides]|nr:hypothetical protein [Adiantum nelumboides]